MPLVTTTEMFKKAYAGGYAIGAFNVNNMEIIQGIVEAATEEQAPLILQVSSGARKYANTTYLTKMVEAAVETSGLPICLHLDHGDSFALCKDCVDHGFTSVMIDASAHPFAENISITKQVVEYAHDHGVVVEAELGKLAGIEDAVNVAAKDAQFTDPDQVEEFVNKTGVDSLAIAIGTSHGAYKFKGQPQLRFDILEEVSKDSPSFCTVLRPFRKTSSRSSTNTAEVCPAHKAFPKICSAKQLLWQSARSTSTPTSVLHAPPQSASTLLSILLTSILVNISDRPERQ